MAKVDPNALDSVLKDAGISDRMAKKIRDANGAETPRPRGQGSDEQPEFAPV